MALPFQLALVTQTNITKGQRFLCITPSVAAERSEAALSALRAFAVALILAA
jgi:hypothetical protein